MRSSVRHALMISMRESEPSPFLSIRLKASVIAASVEEEEDEEEDEEELPIGGGRGALLSTSPSVSR